MKKSFASKNPELMKEWDFEKNIGLDPYELLPNSKVVASWICKKNPKHTWSTSLSNRNNGSNCLYCAGKKVLGEESFGALHPELLKQWHPTKNKYLDPYQLTSGTRKKAWWICSKDYTHIWQASIYGRVKGTGCPYCSGKLVNESNSLASQYPNLLKEWDWEKNKHIDPYKTYKGSVKKVSWICKNDPRHVWESAIYLRTAGNRCHYCTKQKTLYEDSLEALMPEIAKEWHPTKNGNLKPSEIPPGSTRQVWWICEKGHTWKTTAAHRKEGTGCPNCNEANQTSFPEQAIYYYLKNVFPNTENKSYVLDNKKRFEMDVYVPDLKLCVEFDGYLHEQKKRMEFDELKNQVLKKQGIQLIRMRDSRLSKIQAFNSIEFEYSDRDKDYIKKCILFLKNYFNEHYDLSIEAVQKMDSWDNLNIQQDSIFIKQNIEWKQKENSIEKTNPELLKEWHPTKNGMLKPSNFTAGSHQKIWWICEKNHEWFVPIKQRTLKKTGCPTCAGQRPTDENNLKVKFPEIALEWDYEKNGSLLPENVMPNTTKKVWWKCQLKAEHKWFQSIPARVKGVGCPYCYQRRSNSKGRNRTIIVTKEESLEFLSPVLSKEWHPELNGNVTPSKVSLHSNKQAWWICSKNKNHVWEAMINNRSKGQGCPYCSGKKVSKENSLAVLYPEITKQWNYKKNGELTPYDVTSGSSKKVWWVCSDCGHEWATSINNRSRKNGTGCPKCSKKGKASN